MAKVKCIIAPGQNLGGIYAGGDYTEGQEVELDPQIAQFYADGGVVTMPDAKSFPKPQEGSK